MNIKINIGEILTKAWKITWKFKVLWIFGILAGCAGNNRGNFNFNSGSRWNTGNGNNGGTLPNNQIPQWFRQFQDMRPEQAVQAFLNQYMGIIIAVILLLCVLWLVCYFLGVMGKTGLIKGVSKADADAEALTFGEIWSESMPYFWRMFGLSILVGLPFFLLVVIILAVLGFGVFTSIQAGGTGGGIAAMMGGTMLVFFCLLCIIGILGIFVGLIVEQAQNAIVLEDLGVLPGLGRGWEIFSKNWLTVVVVGLIQWVIGVVVGIIIALPLIVVLIPAAIGMGAAAATNNWAVVVVLICGCLVFWIPVSLLLSGVENTYFQSVWTLTYRRLIAPAEPVVLPPSVEVINPQ